jgi:hypothetical protein
MSEPALRGDEDAIAEEVAGMIADRIGEALGHGEGEVTPMATDSRHEGASATIWLADGRWVTAVVTVEDPVDL